MSGVFEPLPMLAQTYSILVPTTATNGLATISTKSDPNIDLLSGDFASPLADNTLALVPVGEHQATTSVSNPNNALALMDMFSETHNNQQVSEVGQAYPSTPQYQAHQEFQPPEDSIYHANGIGPNMMASQYEQSQYTQAANPAWNGQLPPQLQLPSPAYGAQTSSSLPLPPWEAHPTDDDQSEGNQYPLQMQAPQSMPGGTHQGYQPTGSDQVHGMCMQPIPSGHIAAMNDEGMYPRQMPAGQMGYMYPQQMYNN